MTADALGNHINIVNIRADNTHTGHIIEIFFHRLHRNLEALAVQFFNHAEDIFHTAFDGLDRVMNALNLRFSLQDFQLGTNFLDTGLIQRHGTLHFHGHCKNFLCAVSLRDIVFQNIFEFQNGYLPCRYYTLILLRFRDKINAFL